jgi:hypothetical protein
MRKFIRSGLELYRSRTHSGHVNVLYPVICNTFENLVEYLVGTQLYLKSLVFFTK